VAAPHVDAGVHAPAVEANAHVQETIVVTNAVPDARRSV
jgi:hypothetical protein